MEFLVVFGLMWLVVAAIYVTLFSVGTGLGPVEEAPIAVTKKEAEVPAATHRIPHAA